ncbi:uncharacterized protein TNCV_178241 [Trichonephila clavipes]|nr:uncharacterized protein TNCV_178241 [Trichonephila clavipes]
MGTNISTGFQELPEVYLRDLRRKTRRRYKSVLIDRQSKAYLEKKVAPDEGGAAVLNADTVAEYVISNPDFLDNLVEKHIAQDRVRAWIKESMEGK